MISVMPSSFQNTCLLGERVVCVSHTENDHLVGVLASHFQIPFLRERKITVVEHLLHEKHRSFTYICIFFQGRYCYSPAPTPTTLYTFYMKKCRFGEGKHMPRVPQLVLISSKYVILFPKRHKKFSNVRNRSSISTIPLYSPSQKQQSEQIIDMLGYLNLPGREKLRTG